MWDTLFRVDWGRLTHAYGWARDVPSILHNIVARDQARRAEGWDAFFSAIIHQGSIYNSTVAAIPFLIEAAANPDTPERARILYYLRDFWLRSTGARRRSPRSRASRRHGHRYPHGWG